MKSPISILLFILFLLPAYAQFENSEVRFSVLNDSWGGGNTPIYDDLRTGGFRLEFIKENRLKIDTRFSLLTNRFDHDSIQRIALDESSLSISIPILQLNQPDDLLWIKFGALSNGSMLGTQLQKGIHNILDVSQPDLFYSGRKKTHFLFGYFLSKNIFTRHLKDKNILTLKLKHAVEVVNNYAFRMDFEMPWSLTTSNNSEILFSTNYTLNAGQLFSNNLHRKVMAAESGLNFSLKLMGKIFFYYFNIYPKENFSLGGFGFRLKNENRSDRGNGFLLRIEGSLVAKGYGYNLKYSFLPTSQFNRRMAVIVNHNFRSLLKSYLPHSPKMNGHATQFTLGAEMNLLKTKRTKRLIEPFTNISFGDHIVSIYSKIYEVNKKASHHFIVNNDLGATIHLPIRWNGKRSLLNFSFYHRFMFLHSLTPKRESIYFNKRRSPYASFQKTFGGGISFTI